MQWIIPRSCRVAFVLLLLAGAAQAAPLATDPAAMTGWKGTASFTGKMPASVEYAVYAPGQFSASAALGNPADPSGGTDWVYAYEIIAGNTPVLTLTVNITPGNVPLGYVGSNRIGELAGVPVAGESPDAGIINVFFNISPSLNQINNARWTNGTNLDPLINTNPDLWKNNTSTVLFFTAPAGPKLVNSSLSGGGSLISSQNLPSPVPEPTTVILAVVAGASLLAIQWRRRRAAFR